MDIFTFHNPSAGLRMEQGEIVNGITSKMWVERYAEAGEFTLVAPTSSGLREKLPIGSFISHTNTDELMIVENHEVNDQKNEESKITVTGRGFETSLEQRIVGSNRTFPRSSDDDLRLLVPSERTWNQVKYLIERHILPEYVLDPNNAFGYITVQSLITGVGVEPDTSRRIDTNNVYSEILKLMAIDNFGIKIVRPGVWSPLGAASPNTAIQIHKGVDRTDQVIFSYDTGEIVNAEYLWSDKEVKNSAVITGRWIQTIVHLGPTNYARRMMAISAPDIDDFYPEAPVETFLTFTSDQMKQRGREVLRSQKSIVLAKAEVSKQLVNSEYRINFNTGDLITVVGDYNESSVMRVNEFVEIEDANGSVAYPTLSLE